MKKINKLKKIIFVLIIAVILIMGIYTLLFILPNKNKEIKYSDEVLNYVLYKRDSDLSKEIFNKLKSEINGETNYENYASYVAELFIIDLYTLSNKEYETDITSAQYVYETIRDNFKLKVSDTLYKNILLNDEVPTVINITVNNIETDSYKIDNNTYDSYIVNLNWEYDNDYGYDTNKLVTLINVNNNMYIVNIGDINE